MINAVPPPATMPSSTAARVEFNASSIRSLRSFISVSVAAPTLMTATPPANLARRSCNFSRSNDESVSSICALMTLIRFSISSVLPAPSTIVVLSFVTLTFCAVPNISCVAFFKSIPKSSVIT